MKNLIIFTLLVVLSACTNNSGTGVINKETSVASQGSGEFGTITYGQSPIKSFVFKNNGASAVSGTPVINGTGFDLALSLGCGTIEPGKNCLVKIMFNSLTKESGNYSATLTVGDSVVNLSASLPSVPTPSYEFSVNNQSVGEGLNLGELSGRTVKILSVKIKNNSPKTGQVSSISFSNAKFLVVGNQCSNLFLKPNQSCVAKVVVQGDNSNNELTTSVSFDGQSGNLSAQQVEQILNGNMISVASAVTLGDFYQEGVNKIQILKIENLGSGVGSIENIDLPPGYSVGSNNCINIKPKNSCIIRLIYHSEDLVKGSHTDSVQIGDSSVDLTVNQVSNPNSLSSVVISEIPEEFLVVDCVPVKVVVKDNEGLDFVSSGSLALSSSLSLFSDNACAESANLTLNPFVSELNGYYKTSDVGSKTLTVSINSISGHKNFTVYSVLGINPESSSITLSNNQAFSGVGGKPPYAYEVVSGVGSFSDNVYSSNVAGVAQIKVTDGLGQIKETSITVNSNLVLTAGNCSYNVPESMTCQVSASGGIGNKTYTTDQGEINATSGVFKGQCVDNIGSAQVTVTDEYNNSDNITLTYPCVYVSCNQIKAESYGLTSAVYWIDLDGLNFGSDPQQVYCDQEQEKGGWALVAKYGDTSANSYHWFRGVTGSLGLNNSFSSTMQISNLANSLVVRSSEIKVNYNSTWPSYFTINNLTADKNRLWGGTPANLQLGTMGVRPTSGFTGTNYNSGQAVRMHFGSYGGAQGSGFTSGVGSNQTLETISIAANYGTYRLPGIGSTPGGAWPIQNNLLQAYVKETYYKHARTCQDAQTRGIKNQDGNLGSGIYTVDPDGANMGMDPFNVYCDQETDGGGWTLVSYAGPFSGSKSTVTGSATAFMPLFHVYGTINANPFVTKPSFSRFDLFKSMATGSSRFMAKRTSVPAKMISWSLVSPSYWGGTNSTLPAGTQTVLRMTNSGNGGWQNKTNAFFTTAGAGDTSYPGISWNTALYENSDGTGSFTTSLSRRSILYWASVNSDPVSYGPQWFHASPLNLAPSTSPSNTVMDVEFYFRELP